MSGLVWWMQKAGIPRCLHCLLQPSMQCNILRVLCLTDYIPLSSVMICFPGVRTMRHWLGTKCVVPKGHRFWKISRSQWFLLCIGRARPPFTRVTEIDWYNLSVARQQAPEPTIASLFPTCSVGHSTVSWAEAEPEEWESVCNHFGLVNKVRRLG